MEERGKRRCGKRRSWVPPFGEGVDIKRAEMSRRNREQSCAIGSFPNSFHGPEVGIVFALSIGFPSVVGANGTTNADCRCRDADSRGVGYAPRSTYTSNETAR